MASGAELERLVADIERLLAPEGVSVEVRQRVFGDDGVQIAEFDVIIRGSVGSSSINWLIECRDRPSEGSAPSKWIEQLVGRRNVHGFDKVFAASTTGFSSGATDIAQRHGITLRIVDDMTELSSVFTVREFLWTFDDIKIGVSINFVIVAGQRPSEIAEPDDIQVWRPDADNCINMDQFILDVLEQRGTYDGQRPDGIATVQQLAFLYPDELDVSVRREHLRIKDLQVPIEITHHALSGKLLAAKRYAEGSRVIGQEGKFEVPDPEGGFFSCRVQVVNQPDGSEKIVAQLVEDGGPLWGNFELL